VELTYPVQRKGYNPNIEDVGVILAIHNIVNEKGIFVISSSRLTRSRVGIGERVGSAQRLVGSVMVFAGNAYCFLSCSSSPKLKRFVGRPGDVSPKAYLRALMG
jgi:hypothetical protein